MNRLIIKILLIVTTTILFLNFFCFGFVQAENSDIEIYVNKNLIESDVSPVIINDRVCVPIRFVAEALGFGVVWFSKTNSVGLTNHIYTITINLNNPIMQKETRVYAYENMSRDIALDAVPFLYNDRTMVPIRAVAEAFNATVEFEESLNQVNISLPYDFIEDFSDGVARVKKGNKYGYIDIEGKEITDLIYSSATPFSSGCAIARRNDGEVPRCALLSTSGQEIILLEADINRIVGHPEFLHISPYGTLDGSQNGKHGIAKSDGTIPVPIIYDSLHIIDDERIAVCLNNKWGIIDFENNVLGDFVYDDIDLFNERGYALIQKNGRVGYIDKNFKETVPAIYDFAYHNIGGGFSSLNEIVPVKKDGKWGFIDFQNNIQIEFEYENAYPFIDNSATVLKNGKWGFINKDNQELTPFCYDNCKFNAYSDVYILSCKGKWGIIDTNSNVILPFEYDEINGFVWGAELSVIRKDFKRGYVNSKGEIVTPLIYDEASDFFDSPVAKVMRDGRYGFIDKNGVESIPAIYTDAGQFYAGLVNVKSPAGLWGYVNQDNDVVLPFIYNSAGSFHDYLQEISANVNIGGQRYTIDLTGKPIEVE